MRRWDDVIINGVDKKSVEKSRPIQHRELPIRSLTKLAPGPALRVAIDHDDSAVLDLAARLGLGELRGIERPVAAAADDDHVSQRMSLPPSTTSTVPVT